ncbi:MAG: patatin-like phospholipase family protein [Hyphomicrobium sp.]
MTASDDRPNLSGIDIFAGLSEPEKAGLAARFETLSLRRGDVLIRQGDEAGALYITVSGRFAVTRDGRATPVTEIGAGQPVGEIAFLAGGTRTATVTALRDGLVLRLTRESFEKLTREQPSIWQALTLTLAGRLAATTAALQPPPDPKPRTIAVIRAGGSKLPDEFYALLKTVFESQARTLTLTSSTAPGRLGASANLDSPSATAALNALEGEYDFLLFLADDDLSPWSEKIIRHADLVISAGFHDADATLNSLEEAANRYLGSDARRLVLLHKSRRRLSGTARWFKDRTFALHHHIALNTRADTERLFRFINGTARGLVACGGGAWGPAHTGVFKALTESGFEFDIMGGASVGAAMTAAFMLRSNPQDMEDAIHEMFVTRKAMRRYTWPRYAVLDHRRFDGELQRLYGTDGVEDLWLPFFAVSTNLSRYALHVHRQGPLWQVVRASASIPVLLPPVYTDEGEMLVDGGLLDNVPLRVMHDLKSGPNAVISFMTLETERFDVNYAALPSRMELLRLAANPWRKGSIPNAPGVVSVLMRAMMANRNAFKQYLSPQDVLLVPPIPQKIGLLDWHRHTELFELSYRWGLTEVERLERDNPQALAGFKGR